MTKVRSTDRLSAAEVADVLTLAAAAEHADGVYPLSEDVVLRVRNGGGTRTCCPMPATSWPVTRSSADGSGELVVHPAAPPAAATAPRCSPPPATARCAFWAHGDEPAAQAFADRHGFARARVLWQMRRPLADPAARRPAAGRRDASAASVPATTRRPGWRSTRAPSRTTPSRAAGPVTTCCCARPSRGSTRPVSCWPSTSRTPARLPLDQGPPGGWTRSARSTCWASTRRAEPRPGCRAERGRPAASGRGGSGPRDALCRRVEHGRGGALPQARLRGLPRRRQLPARLAGKVSSAQAGKVSPAHAGKVSGAVGRPRSACDGRARVSAQPGISDITESRRRVHGTDNSGSGTPPQGVDVFTLRSFTAGKPATSPS